MLDSSAAIPDDRRPIDMAQWRRTRRVLVLQGGGALGAYQAGVYEGLARRDLAPQWVAGISIGAINAALIAGNPPERRVERLRQFWNEVSSLFAPLPAAPIDGLRTWINRSSAALVAAIGAPGFFHPHLVNPFLAPAGTAAAISVYDTAPLRASLERLVDFDRLNDGSTRLTVGAVNVLTGNSVAFDSTQRRIGPDHIMASGALPPGFPPVVIDGDPYWDGGLVTNTPLQFVLDEQQREDLLVFQIDLFNARGPVPRDLADVEDRIKDIRYSSRTRLNTDMLKRIHDSKKALRALIDRLPENLADDPVVKPLRRLAQEYATTVVQLIYRQKPYEGGTKDFEFSRQTMLEHWASGLADVDRCAEKRILPQTRHSGLTVIDPGLAE